MFIVPGCGAAVLPPAECSALLRRLTITAASNDAVREARIRHCAVPASSDLPGGKGVAAVFLNGELINGEINVFLLLISLTLSTYWVG